MTARDAHRRLRGHRGRRRQPRPHRRAARRDGAATSPGSRSSTTRRTAATAARCAPASRPPPRTSSSTPTATPSTTRASCAKLCEAFGPDVDFVNGYKIGRSDPAAPHRDRPRLPLVRADGLRPAAARRGLRLPADAARRLRQGACSTRSSGVICVELMKKVQDHGFRIAEVPGAPLPPLLRQEPVLQLPARGAGRSLDLMRLWCELVVRKEHLRRRKAAAPAPRAAADEQRLPRLLPGPPGPGHRRPGLHRLEPVPHAGRPRAPRCWPWTACSPTTAATSSTSPATRTGSGSTSPTCAATAWSTWCAARRCSSTWRARSATSTP